jgi:hypothetical protein
MYPVRFILSREKAFSRLLFSKPLDILASMEGYTLTELSELLGLPYNTVKTRVFRAKIRPITKDALYDKAVLKILKNTPGRGRPAKSK